MERHYKALGLLHVVYGVLGIATTWGIAILTSRAGLLFGRIRGDFGHFEHGLVGGDSLLHLVGLHLMGGIVLLGLASIVAGCGMIGHKRWARTFIMILGIIALFNLPFGTALGIYTLWVVMQPEAKEAAA